MAKPPLTIASRIKAIAVMLPDDRMCSDGIRRVAWQPQLIIDGHKCKPVIMNRTFLEEWQAIAHAERGRHKWIRRNRMPEDMAARQARENSQEDDEYETETKPKKLTGGCEFVDEACEI